MRLSGNMKIEKVFLETGRYIKVELVHDLPHRNPSPTKPEFGQQVHVKLPIVFVQNAFTSQRLLYIRHSLISSETKACLIFDSKYHRKLKTLVRLEAESLYKITMLIIKYYIKLR